MINQIRDEITDLRCYWNFSSWKKWRCSLKSHSAELTSVWALFSSVYSNSRATNDLIEVISIWKWKQNDDLTCYCWNLRSSSHYVIKRINFFFSFLFGVEFFNLRTMMFYSFYRSIFRFYFFVHSLNKKLSSMMYRKYFDPLDYNLSADFRLTKLSDIKGWGCKVPRDVLHRLLEGLQTADKNGYGDGQHHQGLILESKPTPVVGKLFHHEVFLRWFCLFLFNNKKQGIGLDSCVIPLRHGGLFLVQSTDFFYPLVDDPYVMVRFFSILKTLLIHWLN